MAKRPFSSTIAPRSRLSDPAWATASRLSAIEVSVEMTDSQLTANSSSRAASEARSSRCAIDRTDRHLRRLPLHGGGQQPVAVAEPFVERFLGAAGTAGDGGHGELVALLDHQRKRCVQHVLLTRRQRLAAIDLQSCQQSPALSLTKIMSDPYRTLRFGARDLRDQDFT